MGPGQRKPDFSCTLALGKHWPPPVIPLNALYVEKTWILRPLFSRLTLGRALGRLARSGGVPRRLGSVVTASWRRALTLDSRPWALGRCWRCPRALPANPKFTLLQMCTRRDKLTQTASAPRSQEVQSRSTGTRKVHRKVHQKVQKKF